MLLTVFSLGKKGGGGRGVVFLYKFHFGEKVSVFKKSESLLGTQRGK